VGGLLDQRFSTFDSDDPLLYAAELLSLARSSADTRTSLVNLVGLLELLLARNPDSARFNVEDSLTKQFVLKVGVLLHSEHPERDMSWVRAALRDLYSLRSAIAHGNFSGLDKLLSKSRFVRPNDGDGVFLSARLARMEVAREFAYDCARCGLWAAIKDPQLVQFLKEN
jgi:hypothetical protein